MKARTRFLSAYHQLACFGGWSPQSADGNSATIKRPEKSIYNTSTCKWVFQPPTTITLFENCTYSVSGGTLSYYDREVLESLQFTKI